MDKKVKILLLSIGIALLVAIISTSYAFFTISNKTGSEETITSGTMALTLHDGSKIETNFMIPGEYIEKTFYVTNTGSLATSYDIYLSEVVNDFADKTDLVYTLTSNDGGYSTSNQVQVPSASAKIVDNQAIGTTTTHHYTLRITFLNKNEAQDDNQGKHFSGKIQINEYQDVSNDDDSSVVSCPDCNFLYYIVDGSNVMSYGDGAMPLTSQQMSLIKTDYQDVISESGKDYFLGVKVNPSTNIIEKAYGCAIKGEEPNINTLFCIEGSHDGSTYNANRELLVPLYGEGAYSPIRGCHDSTSYMDCVSTNHEHIGAYTDEYGNISIVGTDGSCGVSSNGQIGCN